MSSPRPGRLGGLGSESHGETTLVGLPTHVAHHARRRPPGLPGRRACSPDAPTPGVSAQLVMLQPEPLTQKPQRKSRRAGLARPLKALLLFGFESIRPSPSFLPAALRPAPASRTPRAPPPPFWRLFLPATSWRRRDHSDRESRAGRGRGAPCYADQPASGWLGARRRGRGRGAALARARGAATEGVALARGFPTPSPFSAGSAAGSPPRPPGEAPPLPRPPAPPAGALRPFTPGGVASPASATAAAAAKAREDLAAATAAAAGRAAAAAATSPRCRGPATRSPTSRLPRRPRRRPTPPGGPASRQPRRSPRSPSDSPSAFRASRSLAASPPAALAQP